MKSINLNTTNVPQVEPKNDKISKAKSANTLTTRTRDPLSNITNAKKLSEDGKKKDNITKVGNNHTKRTSSNLENESKALRNKKRKSDPMIIDEEEDPDPMVVLPVEPIDQNDYDDPQAVVEYVNDIYQYLMQKEKDRVDPGYLATQVDINEKMRGILVDWLVEVHRMFKLLPETLYLGVAIIDRFLSIKPISRDTLQLGDNGYVNCF